MGAALIILEGIDGAGTTTQAERLAERLRRDGHTTHLTREPSTGPVGVLLREILAGVHEPTDATTHGLLFAADRADHLQREILPALDRGEIVVCDRYYHSSLAYQGTAEDRQWIAGLNRRARRPDLTVFLEVAVEEAASRRSHAGRDDELFDQLDLQRQVADNYRSVMAELAASERIEIVDGHLSIDAIGDRLYALARETIATVGASP